MNKLTIGVLTLSLMGMSLSCGKKNEPTFKQPPKPKTEEPSKPDEKPKDPKDNPQNPDTPPKDKPGDKPQDDKPKGEDPKGGDDPQGQTPPQAERPADHEMASRATAKWKVEGDALYKAFDLETLWLDNKTDKYTAQYLSSFVELASSKVDGGSSYVFTANDLKETAISAISYNEHTEEIKLKIKYKSSESKELSLEFKKSEYYGRKVSAKSGATANLYLTGVNQHLSVFLSDLFEYDTDRYVLELEKNSNPSPDYSAQTLMAHTTLSLKTGNRELTKLQLKAEGFRPFAKLKEDLKVMSGTDLLDYAKEQYQKQGNGNSNNNQMLINGLKARLSNSQSDNTKNLFQFQGRNEEMVWEGLTLKSAKNEKDFLDLYFPNTRLSVTDAKFVTTSGQTMLRIELKLEAIGDTAVEGVTYSVQAFVPRGGK